MDIQNQKQWAESIHTQITLIKQGQIKSWTLPMNAYELHLEIDSATITPLYPEQGEIEVSIPLNIFQKELEHWIHKIS